jgi:hypothetical protein
MNDLDAVKQIQPAIDLLLHMDTYHPDVLRGRGIQPGDYHPKLVFRSAVESIRGTYIASSLTQRQGLVAQTLEALRDMHLIASYKPQTAAQRFDFEVLISSQPRKMGAIEVKGGEGNSINISERPLWADEFILWCHLDGAIVNQPAHGAGAIIFNRVSSEMVKRHKHVDAIVIKDSRCGTPLRPCPKYPKKEPGGLGVAPCIFLLPQRLPSASDPSPLSHDSKTIALPFGILTAHGVAPSGYSEHLYEVMVEVVQTAKGRVARKTSVYHAGKLIESRTSVR